MRDVKDLYIASDTLNNAPNYDSEVLSVLINSVDSIARMNYPSVYLIDCFKHEFLYVSDNPLFLCGLKAKEVKELGHRFYAEHVPEEEQKMLVELSRSGLKLLDTFDNADKCKCSMSFNFHLCSGKKSKLINNKITPILLTDDGRLWIGSCVVSLPPHKTAGHIEFRKKGLDYYWQYSMKEHHWIKSYDISFKEEELEVLQLSAAGLTMAEIAEKMCRSLNTVKYYKREVFDKLGASNIAEAITRAELNKLF
jgi:DNA-binding CsgD family transcriptional regulator